MLVLVLFNDHLLLLCHLFIQNILSPSVHWHFNSVLAADKSFRDAFSYLWTDSRQEDNVSMAKAVLGP